MKTLSAQPFRAGPAAPRPSAIRRTRCVSCRAVSAPVALTDIEKKALGEFRSASPSSGSSKAEALQVLKRAAATKDVSPELVEGALLAVEQLSALENNGPTPNVSGRWRLLFGTATKFRPFQYIPVKEDFVLDTVTKDLSLESSVGPLQFFIRGTMREWKPDGGELDFQFGQVDVHFNGNKVWEVTPKAKPKTYTFFHVAPDMACARSSGGGVALLTK